MHSRSNFTWLTSLITPKIILFLAIIHMCRSETKNALTFKFLIRFTVHKNSVRRCMSALFFIIIIIRTSSTGPSGKNRIVKINFFRNPTSTSAKKNWRNHNWGKQPTVDCTLEFIQSSCVKYSVGKVVPHSNLSRQERPSKLGRYTHWYIKLQWMSNIPAVLVYWTPVEADGSSLNRQWLEFELTLYSILNPATRRRWHNYKKVWSGQRLANEYTWRLRSWRWHSAGDPYSGEQYSRIAIGFFFCLCGLGIRIQPTFAQVRVVRDD